MSDDKTAPQKLDLSNIQNTVKDAGINLIFDQQAVQDAVTVCNDLITVLEEAGQWSTSLDKIEGMDKFDSALALSKGLGDRAGDSEGSFRQALNEHKETVKALREAIEKAGKGYVDADGKIQTDFTSLNFQGDS